MECNKDEAVKCRDMAEKKLKEKDTVGAKRFALRAQTLFPTLDGISGLINVINIYDEYEKKINGEVNWYRILGVSPSADEQTLSKQFRVMALSLHPDKNKFFGADGAFKILSQARSVLSDKQKRLIYDLKMNFRAPDHRVSAGDPPFAANTYNFSSCSSSQSSKNAVTSGNPQQVPMSPWTSASTTSLHYNSPAFWPRYPSTATGAQRNSSNQTPPDTATNSQYVATPPGPRSSMTATGVRQMSTGTAPVSQFSARPPVQRNPTSTGHHPCAPSNYSRPIPRPPSRRETFWTSCSLCRTHYEFQNIYLNQTLLCHNCRQPYLAIEMPAPPSRNVHKTGPRSFHHQKAVASSAKVGSQYVTDLGSPQVAHRVQSDSEQALQRNDSDPVDTVAPSISNNPVKKRRIDVQRGNTANDSNQMSAASRAAHRISSRYPKGNSRAEWGSSASHLVPGTKELSQSGLRTILMKKAKSEILRKLNECSIAAGTKSAHKKHRNKETEKLSSVHAITKAAVDDVGLKKNKNDQFVSSSMKFQLQQSSMYDGTGESDANLEETVSMNVPDADFYNFDKDRVESSFLANQVWALYDDDDGMPRYYALIHDVISRKPFKMQISWLNSKNTNEFASSLDWVSSGFPKTCGYFRVGKSKVHKNLSSFSHLVQWKKGARGAIQIFPTKGEVWALYRNWSPDWNELTEDNVIHKYDLVVILEDYHEETGTLVSPLIKLAGFKSVFRQPLDPIQSRTIPKEEMFRFSHQVASHMVTGHEAPNVLPGSRDLDTAALPLELLQVITEDQLVGSSKATKKESSSIPNAEIEVRTAARRRMLAEPLLKYSRRHREKDVQRC